MPIIEDEIIGSQSEDESKETEDKDDLDDVLALFDVAPKKEVITPAPAIEKETPKTVKIKHNHGEEDVDISTDEKLQDHLQRSLALDKERDRVKQHETELNRTAKLLGFKDHVELTANLEMLEKNQLKEQEDKHQQLEQKMIDDLVDNGVTEESAREYIKNNPLIQEGRRAMEAQQQASKNNAVSKSLQELFEAFPDLEKPVEGVPTPWYTPEMHAMVEKGYTYKDAHTLLNLDKIQTQSKKATEQRVIKEQQLGLRSRVETNPAPDNEKQVPAALANAFAAFGLPAESAKKYVK